MLEQSSVGRSNKESYRNSTYSCCGRNGLADRPYSLAPPQLESGSRVRYETGNSKAVPASATMGRPLIVADWRSHFDRTALRHRNSKAVPASATKQATRKRFPLPLQNRQLESGSRFRYKTGNSKAVPASATKHVFHPGSGSAKPFRPGLPFPRLPFSQIMMRGSRFRDPDSQDLGLIPFRILA